MDLFYGRMSGNSARSVFGLLEAGSSFTPRLVDTRAGENRRPDYLALNPTGKIPALADGDFRLWESNAINWYAAEQNPSAGLLPATPAGRAAVQRWLFFQSAHVSPACGQLFLSAHPRMREFWQTREDPKAVEAAHQGLSRWLPVLQSALDRRDWLEGGFTLADVAYAPHLSLIVESGFDLAPYPAVRAWLERTLARPAWREARALVFEP
jgi:glutathione S-transferase